MVRFAQPEIAGPRFQLVVIPLVAQAHLHVQIILSGHHSPARLRALLPVVHVVLLKGARRAKSPDAGQPCAGWLQL